MNSEENIKTDINKLERELEDLRTEFTQKLTLIEGKLTSLKEKLPTKKEERAPDSFKKGDRVLVTRGTYKGKSGIITRVTNKSAWLKLITEKEDEPDIPVIKRINNIEKA